MDVDGRSWFQSGQSGAKVPDFLRWQLPFLFGGKPGKGTKKKTAKVKNPKGRKVARNFPKKPGKIPDEKILEELKTPKSTRTEEKKAKRPFGSAPAPTKKDKSNRVGDKSSSTFGKGKGGGGGGGGGGGAGAKSKARKGAKRQFGKGKIRLRNGKTVSKPLVK